MTISRGFGALLLLTCSLPLAAQAPEFRLISQAAYLERASAAPEKKPLVLDVRTAQEFAAGHVPGAINLPHDQIETRIDELEGARDRDVIVYCRSGRRADLALRVLRAHGFEKLWHVEGDFLAWEAANRPVERESAGPAPPAPVTEPKQP